MRTPIRTTFGITNPETNRKYFDIISASIIQDIFNHTVLKSRNVFYIHNKIWYLLDMDSKLISHIKRIGWANVNISLQRRHAFNIAIARLPEINTKPNNNERGIIYVSNNS